MGGPWHAFPGDDVHLPSFHGKHRAACTADRRLRRLLAVGSCVILREVLRLQMKEGRSVPEATLLRRLFKLAGYFCGLEGTT